MNLDELRSVQAKERRKDSLQHLRDDFYDDVAAYVADLRAARDRRAEQVANPFADDDVRRMSDELETAEEVGEALYERRVGKVVKLASFAAADMSVDTEGMTSQERALFDDLVERIEANKSRVFDALAGGDPVGPNDGSTRTPDPAAGDPAANESPVDGATASDPTADTPPSNGSPPDAPAVNSPDANADVLAGAMGGDRESSSGPGPHGTDAGAAPAEHDPTPAEPDPSVTPGDDTGAPTIDELDPAGDGVPDHLGGRSDDDPGSAGGRTAAPDGNTTAATTADGERGTTGGTNSDGAGGRDANTDDAIIDRETVRITRDVGSILGVDEREYDLVSEDVVTLPAENAEPLVRRDAAERIE